MATDIKLDDGDGSWVVIQSKVLKSTASDFVLDAPDRRRTNAGLRRAIVHDSQDGLTINFGGDYPGGVTVGGNLRLSGRLFLPDDASGDSVDVVSQLRADVAELKRVDRLVYPERIDRIEQSITSLAALLNSSVVPGWRTKEEVEEGDDMGLEVLAAAALGLIVEYIVWQREPGFSHGEVIQIDPRPGSVVPRGSTIRVTINLEG